MKAAAEEEEDLMRECCFIPLRSGAATIQMRLTGCVSSMELLKGLEEDAVYEDQDTGKCYYGSALMEAGIPMPVDMGEYQAL